MKEADYIDDGDNPPYEYQDPEEDGGEQDMVNMYTKSFSSKMLVAFSAAVGSFLLSNFLSNMIISHGILIVNAVLALAGAVMTFTNGYVADFLKAYGVLLILLVQRFQMKRFALQITRQVKGMLMLSERKYFPAATDNPWKYTPGPDGEDIKFSMMNTMASVGILGAIAGNKIGNMIPIIKMGWLFAIGGGGAAAYLATMSNGQGDFLRFVGWSLTVAYSDTRAAMRDVYFWEKTNVVFSVVVQLAKRLDSQYHIISKLQVAIAQLVAMVTVAIGRNSLNSNKDNSPPPPRAFPPTSNKGRRDGRDASMPIDGDYGHSDDAPSDEDGPPAHTAGGARTAGGGYEGYEGYREEGGYPPSSRTRYGSQRKSR